MIGKQRTSRGKDGACATRATRSLVVGLLHCVLGIASASAGPSTTFWTVATTDVQPFGRWNLSYNSFFTPGAPRTDAPHLPDDIGLTVGVLPSQRLNMEIGIDLLEPTHDPLFFNAKLGTPEGTLFNGSPALNIGLFNAGTKAGVTNQNIVDFIVGRSLPHDLGRLFAAVYRGSDTLRSSRGDVENKGWMLAYQRGFWPDKAGDKEFNRVVLAADYASGRNAIGGGGVGLYIFFWPNVNLLTGPVWFNDTTLNGDYAWTVQFNFNF